MQDETSWGTSARILRLTRGWGEDINEGVGRASTNAAKQGAEELRGAAFRAPRAQMLLRRPAGDVGVHRRGPATTQMRPRRRNPKGAWVLRAIASLLVVDDVHRHRLPPRALRSPHFHSPIWKFARSGTLRVNTHARDPS